MNLESYLSTTLSKSSTLDDILNNGKQDELPTSSNNASSNRNSFSESVSNSSLDDSTTDDSSSSSSPPKKLKTTHDGYDTDDEDESESLDEELSDELKNWIKSTHGTNPRVLLKHIIPSYVQIPDDLDDYDIFKLLKHLMNDDSSSQIQRIKLPNVNTLEQAVDLIRKSKNIIVLTGAGCSVSCGIPDFRSRNGIYARLSKDFPDLPDPQSMFDIYYFKHNPRPFFKFAKEIYPGQFKPSLSHNFIKKIEEHNKLLRNYTQNIDTLELVADIKRVIQCHGSFATASCTSCKRQVNADDIKEKIFNQEIPKCEQCNDEGAIIKPDIVFFGENLPEEYHKSILDDKNTCDLLIVIGSSLKVRPVANIPNLVSPDIPQILINRESLPHFSFDIELLGDCDVIVNELLLRLGDDWSNICSTKSQLKLIDNEEDIRKIVKDVSTEFSDESTTLAESKISNVLQQSNIVFLKPNMYLFKGAEIKDDTVKYLLSNDKEENDNVGEDNDKNN